MNITDATKECKSRNYDSGTSSYNLNFTAAARNGNGHRIVSKAPSMLELFNKIDAIARSSCSVLIIGGSGTGKESVAKALHYNGPRREKNFSAINCAGIPSELLESTLFGYAKGAFTGAVKDTAGEFEEASGGTLFLDEISEMPLALQSKLLRVLQEREIKRVGETKSRPVDVRVIAATNIDIKAQVKAGKFREDLYYRLNVVPLIVPKLEDRVEDIPLLAKEFVERHKNSAANGTDQAKITDEAIKKIEEVKEWPGNIRQLESVIMRAMILAQNGSIEERHIVFNDDDFQRATITVEPSLNGVGKIETIRGSAIATDGTVNGKPWFEADGGVLPILLSALRKTKGVKSHVTIHALARKGSLYSLPIGNGDNPQRVFYLTQSTLPLVFQYTDANKGYWELMDKLARGAFSKMTARPFMITLPSGMDPGAYRTYRDVVRIAQTKLPKEMLFDGGGAAFILREDDAHLFVPTGRGIGPVEVTERVNAVKKMIRRYYKAFTEHRQLDEIEMK
jgi:DNA-binding NtrC family response regulator